MKGQKAHQIASIQVVITCPSLPPPHVWLLIAPGVSTKHVFDSKVRPVIRMNRDDQMAVVIAGYRVSASFV